MISNSTRTTTKNVPRKAFPFISRAQRSRSDLFVGRETHFPNITRPIQYEGPDTKNPLAFRYYNSKQKVLGKPMSEHLKFAMAYWHTMRGIGGDIFGMSDVYGRSWLRSKGPMEAAATTMEAAFEFMTKLGLRYWCFHDRDIAPAELSIGETNRNLQAMVKMAKGLQDQTGIKLLWGTANLFSHAQFTHGAFTNPDPNVFALAASQVKNALEATVELGGTGYVFWGGREGYTTLLNTNMKRERELLAKGLDLSMTYGKQIKFKGTYFIEPKPKEPTIHQWDTTAEVCLGFLREFGLIRFPMELNLETNHATLAFNSFEHELLSASIAGKLGSLDINQGDDHAGWDTDRFPSDIKTAALVMLILYKQGGLKNGGLNFDAKVRRGSVHVDDLFYAHIGGMDTYARGLLTAERIIKDGRLMGSLLEKRYAKYDSGMGAKILAGKTSLTDLEKWAEQSGTPTAISGQQEFLENLLNQFLV